MSRRRACVYGAHEDACVSRMACDDYDTCLGTWNAHAPPVAPAAEVAKCDVCAWPLAESADRGCVPGNCSATRANLPAMLSVAASAPQLAPDATFSAQIDAAMADTPAAAFERGRAFERAQPAPVGEKLDPVSAVLAGECIDAIRAEATRAEHARIVRRLRHEAHELDWSGRPRSRVERALALMFADLIEREGPGAKGGG